MLCAYFDVKSTPNGKAKGFVKATAPKKAPKADKAAKPRKKRAEGVEPAEPSTTQPHARVRDADDDLLGVSTSVMSPGQHHDAEGRGDEFSCIAEDAWEYLWEEEEANAADDLEEVESVAETEVEVEVEEVESVCGSVDDASFTFGMKRKTVAASPVERKYSGPKLCLEQADF